MTYDELVAHCLSLPGVTQDFPFGDDTAVHRVGGKIFALAAVGGARVNLKCEPEYALHLREAYTGVVPGWHMNKRHWNTVALDGDVPDEVLRDLIDDSYELVRASLPRLQRAALGD